MKVICVVDSITDFNKKIHTLKTHFGNNIIFIVKASLMPIFETFGYKANAIYDKNLSKIIHLTIFKADPADIVVYYTSLKINNKLISDFIAKIGQKNKIVYLMPEYNAFERLCLSAYNVYVKSLFKTNDSLASPKLQFLPSEYVSSLLSSHFGNKLFEMPSSVTTSLYTEDKEINKSAKIKNKFGKSELISLLVAMAITLCLIFTYAFTSPHFIIALIFILLYVLDLFVYLVMKCKAYFDSRFLK